MGTLKVGVVGCGYWGSKHVRILHALPDVEQVVAIDSRAERLVDLARIFPNLVTFPDLASALDHIDAVVIATPPRSHADLAFQAIASGKSVLVEKPLTTSTAEARALRDAATQKGVTLMCGHTFEYNAAVWKLRDLVQSGDLGRVYYVDSARLNLGLYQPDVNVLWDLAPHDVSIFNHILGTVPASVQAWGSRHAHDLLEDVAYLRLLYPDIGVTANIHVSWLDPCKVRQMTVVGSSKMAVYDDLAMDERVRVFDKGVVPASNGSTQNMPMSYRYGEICTPYVNFHEPLECEDQHFVACVATGARPQTDAENGLAVVQVLECAEISLEEDRAVPLSEVSEPVEPSRGLTLALTDVA